MFFDPIDIPDELLEAQEQGKLVIFAGAGVSMGEPSDLPSFKGLAAQIAGSHLLAAEIDRYDARLDRFLGELFRQKVDVQGLCRAKIGDPASKPNELHRSLVDLFIKPEHVRIVTTNFDNHFRSVLDEHSWKPDCFHAPALPLGHQFTGVVYLHGCISRPEPLVLTDEDFGRAYLTEGWAREFLQRLFAEFTTLFVGYSHNDLPVEYLARGMSGKSIAPRFALTVTGEVGQWASLGIREITFEKTPGSNPFQNLYAGVKKWAEFTRQQPTEIAERVKAIVCAPEKLAPDKSQSSVLKRCLEREDSCHFFTREAKGWHWVKWLHEQGLLPALFDASRRELTKPQMDLAYWMAGALLAETSDEGLLLVEQHHGCIGRHLWSAGWALPRRQRAWGRLPFGLLVRQPLHVVLGWFSLVWVDRPDTVSINIAPGAAGSSR
jgi:SIR2-like domain